MRNQLFLAIRLICELIEMLKIVHLITGAAALLLSFIPGLQTDAVPYLQHPDALYLAFFGLLNLTLAPVIPFWNKGPEVQQAGHRSAVAGRTGSVFAEQRKAPAGR